MVDDFHFEGVNLRAWPHMHQNAHAHRPGCHVHLPGCMLQLSTHVHAALPNLSDFYALAVLCPEVLCCAVS